MGICVALNIETLTFSVGFTGLEMLGLFPVGFPMFVTPKVCTINSFVQPLKCLAHSNSLLCYV